jgi:hypothetical protein
MILQKIKETPRIALAKSGFVVISYFPMVGDLESLGIAEKAYEDAVREHGKVFIVTVMPAANIRAAIPDEVKQRAADVVLRAEPNLVGNAMVILGSGLGATILRMFMVGFYIFSKSEKPQKCFGSVDDALDWIRTLAPGSALGLSGAAVLANFGIDATGKKREDSAASSG